MKIRKKSVDLSLISILSGKQGFLGAKYSSLAVIIRDTKRLQISLKSF